MRITTVLVALLALAALGCNSTPPTPVVAGPVTELVPLKIAFDEAFPDNASAKRVVLCQLNDERTHKNYLGEGVLADDPTAMAKYVTQDDPTLVLPRVLAKELKTANLNVALAEKLGEPLGGAPVRELLTRYNGDYVIAGRIEDLTVRARDGGNQPLLIIVSARLDVYNKDGELRMYYPARYTDAQFLGDRTGDPEEVSHALDRAVTKMFDSAMEDAYFLRSLDLDNQAVKRMREAKPLCPPGPPAATTPAETKPTDVKPSETKPAETHSGAAPAEKTEADKKARELDLAVSSPRK